MKKTLIAAVMIFAVAGNSFNCKAQKIGNILNNVLNGGNSNNGGNNGLNLANLSNTDIVSALKEALTIGAQNSSQRLNTVNGFFGNALIKVLMPPEAARVETTLRAVGLGSTVDKTILSMNRAAEDAAGKAAPIFIDAIKSISIQDGVGILRGGNGAATSYLRQRTTAALTQAFRPVIQSSLNKVGATALWSTVFTTFNKLPTTYNKVNPDLTGYVTERALNGLFVQIADEENKIRTNPAARVTSILQKVFGAKQ